MFSICRCARLSLYLYPLTKPAMAMAKRYRLVTDVMSKEILDSLTQESSQYK